MRHKALLQKVGLNGFKMKKWGPRDAAIVDGLAAQGMITWCTAPDRKIAFNTNLTPRLWWFDQGMLIEPTRRGKAFIGRMPKERRPLI